MRISIVIPVFNNAEVLKNNLPFVMEALGRLKKVDTELIFTDDNSQDTSVQFLEQFKKTHTIQTIIIQNSKNGGFAVNVNRGVKAASGEIVILLGTDVKPTPNFIQPLLRYFKNDKIFAVGCVSKSDEDLDNNILRGRGIARWDKGFLIHSYAAPFKNTTLWVDCGSGAFRKSIWDKVGGLQELYAPFYWEDIDLSYRAQKMGYEVRVEKNSIVLHEHKKGSIKKLKKNNYILQIAYRNQFLFVWLNITDKALLLNHFLLIPYNLLTAFKDKNWPLIRGFFNALLQVPKVLNKRKINTSQVKLSDKSIILKFAKE